MGDTNCCCFLRNIFFLKGSVSLDYSDGIKNPNSIIYAVNGDTKETFGPVWMEKRCMD